MNMCDEIHCVHTIHHSKAANLIILNIKSKSFDYIFRCFFLWCVVFTFYSITRIQYGCDMHNKISVILPLFRSPGFNCFMDIEVNIQNLILKEEGKIRNHHQGELVFKNVNILRT